MNPWLRSLAIGLSVCFGAGIGRVWAEEGSGFRVQDDGRAEATGCDRPNDAAIETIAGEAAAGDAADDDPADDTLARDRAVGGKISRGKLFCGLTRVLGRAWILARAERHRRPAPLAADDPFPQGEPADPIPEK